jgi:hypothetical protein
MFKSKSDIEFIEPLSYDPKDVVHAHHLHCEYLYMEIATDRWKETITLRGSSLLHLKYKTQYPRENAHLQGGEHHTEMLDTAYLTCQCSSEA